MLNPIFYLFSFNVPNVFELERKSIVHFMKDYSMKNSRRVIFEKYKEFKFEMHCEQKKYMIICQR